MQISSLNPLFSGQYLLPKITARLPASGPATATADAFTPQFTGRKDHEVRAVTLVQDPVSGKTNRYQHHTSMFREIDSSLSKMPELLPMLFPDGASIEIYAGSNGSDALSLGLILQACLGRDDAAKYKIITSDLFPNLMTRSRHGIVGLGSWNGNMTPFSYCQEQFRLVGGRLDDYIDPEPLPEHPSRQHFHTASYEPPSSSASGERWKKFLSEETLHRIRPDVWKAMRPNIRFRKQPVNAVDELSKPLPKEKANKPRVVFLRNMVYLLSPDDRERLLTALKDNMPAGSMLVLGGSEKRDYSSSQSRDYAPDKFLPQLKEMGWEEIPSAPNVYIKKPV